MKRGALLIALALPACCGAALAALPATHAIPFKRDAETAALSGSGGMAVVLVSLLAIAAVYIVRKRLRLGQRPAGSASLLRVLETRRLGPRALLSVVEFGGKQHLIAQSEHGISCLDTIEVHATPAMREGGDAH